MLRKENLNDITDGHKYGLSDMVRVDTLGCKGCSKCCETMTDTIVLSPYDIFRISIATGKGFNELMQGEIELNMQDGVILPNINGNGPCRFLDSDKRCSIHSNRPDFCRLFPLGRLYEGDSFSYVLQVGECKKAISKIKVEKWIDTKDYEKNSEFILSWHKIINIVRTHVIESRDPQKSQALLMSLLYVFYVTPYDPTGDFFQQYHDRARAFMERL